MMTSNVRFRDIMNAVLCTIAASTASACLYVMSTRANEKDVETNSQAIAAQEDRCAKRAEVVANMSVMITSIDTALKLLVDGYKDSK